MLFDSVDRNSNKILWQKAAEWPSGDEGWRPRRGGRESLKEARGNAWGYRYIPVLTVVCGSRCVPRSNLPNCTL